MATRLQEIRDKHEHRVAYLTLNGYKERRAENFDRAYLLDIIDRLVAEFLETRPHSQECGCAACDLWMETR